MKSALVAWLGCLVLAAVACGGDGGGKPSADAGSDDGRLDAEAPSPDAGSERAWVRWTRSIGTADHAQLAALPDGGMLLVTTVGSQSSSDARVQLRAISPDGAERWSRTSDGSSFNLPWNAPVVAVHPNGDIYLTLGSAGSPGVTIGGDELDCPEGCGAMAAFGPDGDLRWLEAIPNMQSQFITAVDDGVVLALAFGESMPVMMAIASDGRRLWEQPWPFEFPSMSLDGLLAGDGAAGFYVAARQRNNGLSAGRITCGVLAHHSAADGSSAWEREVCGGDVAVDDLSNVVVLGDGTIVALASNQHDDRQLIGFGPDGAQRFVLNLAQDARPRAVHGASALLVAPEIGPLAAVDGAGKPRWQWPGALSDGALTVHPSGPCRSSAAPAPDGDLYVLSLGCASARALLGASTIREQWSGSEEDFPGRDWFLARIDADAQLGSAPRCGNGWRDPGEACDGEDFELPDRRPDGYPAPTMCSSWYQGAGWSGSPVCTDQCSADLSPCESSCGNGELDEGEDCDGAMFRWAQSCDEANLGSGPLGCDDCVVDLSVCPMRASCGNGLLEEWETCDGHLSHPQDGPQTCEEAGLGTGEGFIGCTDDCRERDYTVCEG